MMSMTPQSELSKEVEYSAQQDASIWARLYQLKLQGGVWSYDDHPFLREILSIPFLQRKGKAPLLVCVMKATQLGFPLDINTPVPTGAGWVLMADIRVGEKVFGSDGKLYTVTTVHDVKDSSDCYKVVFSDLSEIVCDGDHLWTLTDEWHYRYKKDVTLTTREIFNSDKKGTRNRYALPVAKPIYLPEKQLPVQPYLLGLWLGDGNSHSAQITCHVDDAEAYSETLATMGIGHTVRFNDKRYENNRNIKLQNSNDLLKIGVLKDKHIPQEYLRASYTQRMELLQGLMDTDGHITKDGTAEFYNTNQMLIEQVKELVLTLGFKAKLVIKCRSMNWEHTDFSGRDIYRLTFRAYSDTPIAKLRRKVERQKPRDGNRVTETERRRIVDVIPVANRRVRCIAVDSPNHLFLAGEDFIPTHNTECMVIIVLHGQIYGWYPRGVLYLFPTNDEVREFSKTRFNPLIMQNPTAIGRYVSDVPGKKTDTATLKNVNGSMLYFRGARLPIHMEANTKMSSKLVNIAVDHLVIDELDATDFEDVIGKAQGRLGASGVGTCSFISNPSIPERGISVLYDKSDQRQWFRRCGCGAWTCAEEHFPDLIGKGPDGKGYVACVKCGKPTDFRIGQWVAKHPTKSDYMWGYQLSQLCSAIPRNDPYRILQDYNDPLGGNVGDVVRMRLGKPYISATDRLTTGAVLACCKLYLQEDHHAGPCAMGIDVRKHINIVIGCRSGRDRYRIVRVARLPGLNCMDDALRMAYRFHVKTCVVDSGPELHLARQFQEKAKFKTWLCNYREVTPVGTHFNDKTGLVTVNRTEICDATHRLIEDEHSLELPSACPEIKQFAFECCNTAKVEVIDKKTKQPTFRYIKLSEKPDDYRHALNYFYLAATSGHLAVVRDQWAPKRPSHARCEYSRV